MCKYNLMLAVNHVYSPVKMLSCALSCLHFIETKKNDLNSNVCTFLKFTMEKGRVIKLFECAESIGRPVQRRVWMLPWLSNCGSFCVVFNLCCADSYFQKWIISKCAGWQVICLVSSFSILWQVVHGLHLPCHQAAEKCSKMHTANRSFCSLPLCT